MKKILALVLALALLLGASALAEAGEGAQEPALAYLGAWVSERLTLYIDSVDDALYAVVYWPDSPEDITQWEYFDLMYDEVTGGLTTLETGVKTHMLYGEDSGELISSEVAYTDGAANFALADDTHLIWTDFKEDPADNQIVFERAAAIGEEELVGPAAQYQGLWASDKALLTVSAHNGTVRVDVVEDNGVTERLEWVYEGVVYDEVADELNCGETGVKTRVEYGDYLDDGEKEELFADGAAAFKLTEDGALIWTDYKEAPGGETRFERLAEIPEEYEGIWIAGDDTVMFITNFGSVASCVVWSADETYRWLYNVAVYDEEADGLRTLANGVKSHIVIDDETTEYSIYEHEYTDGKAFFAFDFDGRLVWVEDWDSEDPAVVFYPYLYEYVEDELHAAAQPLVESPEWVVNLPAAQDPKTEQLFVVAGMGMDKTTATISLHERDGNGDWKQVLSTPGYVGKNGLCLDEDHAEGCGQTPIGVYHFNKAFGIAPDPGCNLPYVQVNDDIYWSGDENQAYNEMVNINDYPDLDMGNSEHIVDYEYEYQYCLNISFNEDGEAGRGSAIFLHCFGLKKPYTGGCVAVPEYIMKQIMQYVTEDCVVVIDTFENLGGSF